MTDDTISSGSTDTTQTPGDSVVPTRIPSYDLLSMNPIVSSPAFSLNAKNWKAVGKHLLFE